MPFLTCPPAHRSPLHVRRCCASTCWIIRYRRSEQRRTGRHVFGGPEGSLPNSILLVHAELLRRREQERREARERQERDTHASLLALPTRAWLGLRDAMAGGHTDGGSGADAEAGGAAADFEAPLECCLCMEAFEKDEQIRLLPCKHYFHRDCIDRWFATRAYQQRSCPLCKRDPLEKRSSVVATASSSAGSPVAGPSSEDGEAVATAAGVPAASRATVEGADAADEGLELVELPDTRRAEQSGVPGDAQGAHPEPDEPRER